jgi:hypothetical protein
MNNKFVPAFKLRVFMQDAVLRAGRAGPLVWLASGLWLAALALATWVLPSQYAARGRDQQALLQAQSAHTLAAQQEATVGVEPMVSERESSQRNAAQFRAVLAQAPLPESAQQTLFALAKRWSLELPQGQYKQACDDSGAWCSYRMQLPVVGSYSAVRGFVQDALHTLPGLALDGAAASKVGGSAATGAFMRPSAHSDTPSSPVPMAGTRRQAVATKW